MRITLVGPCASGKSILARALRSQGYDSHQCSQEHSYVADMWRRVCKPDILIYLDVSIEIIRQRRQINWGISYLQILQHRLRDARQHCDLYLQTDNLSPAEVLHEVLVFLNDFEQKV
jgi:adenylate kinase family enzyme